MDIKHSFKKSFAFVLAVVSACVFSVTPAFAESLSDLEKENSKLEQQIKSNKAERDKLRKQKDTQLEYMDAIDRDIAAVQKQIDNYQSSINDLNKKIADVEAQIKKEQENFDKTYKEYEERIRINYMTGGTSGIEMILGSSDMSQLLTRIELINRISDHDQALLNDLEKKLEEINAKKADLSKSKESLKKQLAEVETKKAEIQKDKNEIQAVINELKKNEDLYTEKIKADEKKQQEVEDDIQSIIGNNGGYEDNVVGSGVFTNPCPGYRYISAGYPNYSSGAYHGGIDFAASHGTPIVAADDGTVISVKRLNYSYGWHLIISHGNGLTTLYAHTSGIFVSAGQHVKKGQKIAQVGQTGNASGNHLHFEVRKNGQRVNPLNYVKL